MAIGSFGTGLGSAWCRLNNRLLHITRTNSPTGSRRNVAHHYDLSNDFYRLWLDPTMTYSSALFTTENQGLEEAQYNKYQHLARMLALRPEDSVLDLGCGWGGFALFVARAYGCRVTPVTLSAKQAEMVQQRVNDAGLIDRIKVHIGDYRQSGNKYGKIAWIELLEAVGERYWPLFFLKLNAQEWINQKAR